MWQDYVISTCILVFIIALIPTIRGANKPELSTSLTTATVQAVLTVTYITMALWFSVATGVLLFICWTTLAVQKWRRPNLVFKVLSNDPHTTKTVAEQINPYGNQAGSAMSQS